MVGISFLSLEIRLPPVSLIIGLTSFARKEVWFCLPVTGLLTETKRKTTRRMAMRWEPQLPGSGRADLPLSCRMVIGGEGPARVLRSIVKLPEGRTTAKKTRIPVNVDR